MHARLLCLALLALPTLAQAGWEAVGKSDTADQIYMDRSTAERRGDIVKINVLFDYFKRQEEGHFSMRLVTEYDCAKKRERDLSVAIHAGNMGAGKVIDATKEPDAWKPVKADTLAESLLEEACKTKVSAPSRWKLMAKEAGTSLFYEPASIKRTGNLGSVLLLIDTDLPVTKDKQSYRSTVSEIRIDCSKKLERTAVVTLFEGPQAQGKKLLEAPSKREFAPIQKDTPQFDLEKLICK